MEEKEFKYVCVKCDFHCDIKSRWEKHIITELHITGKKKIRSDFKEEKKCIHCEYTTRKNVSLKQHYLNNHGTIEERKKEFKYYCDNCDFGTFIKEILTKHKESIKHKYLESINI